MKPRNIILFSGWALFITSFFLPAVSDGGPIPGWFAAWVSLTIFDDIFSADLLFGVYVFSFTPCNILMLLSPIIVFRIKMKKYLHWYRISMSAVTLLVGSWYFYCIWENTIGLCIGYYLWFLSFLLVTISLFMRRPPKIIYVNKVD